MAITNAGEGLLGFDLNRIIGSESRFYHKEVTAATIISPFRWTVMMGQRDVNTHSNGIHPVFITACDLKQA